VSEHSAIQWTDATWNPTTGCTKVSPGCANCYIETTTPFRVQGRKFVGGAIPLKLHEGRLEQPLRWRKPKRIFVNSLSDLFHEDIPFEFIDRVFAVMALTPQHTYQVLTKRPGRMLEYLTAPIGFSARREGRIRTLANELRTDPKFTGGRLKHFETWPLPNVWLGVSVENQHFADERIPLLLQTPAAVRFISAEPLLEEISFRWAKWDDHAPNPRRLTKLPPVERDGKCLAGSINHLDGARMLDWVIVGGESGSDARPFDIARARKIVAECRAAGVPVFVKQLGVAPYDSAPTMPVNVPVRDRKGGDPEEWPADLRVREFPTVHAWA
jgi:protein gp37